MRPWPRGPIQSFLVDVRRRTEPPNGVIRLIIAYKAVSALVLFLLAFFLLGLIVNRTWDERVRDLVLLLGLRADNHFIRHTLLSLGLLGRRSTTALGLISLLYGLLETTEVLGLLNRRRWAEYLVLLATVLFLPYEALELTLHATLSKLLILAINVAIAIYLVRSKHLFQDPGTEEAESVSNGNPPLAERTAEPAP